MRPLSEKVVLVTGASSGIGAGVARELGRAGAKLMIGARRMDRLRSPKEEIEGTSTTARGSLPPSPSLQPSAKGRS